MTETAPQTLVIVQARMGSTRFPGKSLATINGRPILWHMWEQLRFCRHVDAVVLATTDQAKDSPLAEYAQSQGWNVFRGSEDDVLARYHGAALAHGAGTVTGIVRLTGDDILPDPDIVDAVSLLFRAFRGRADYVSTDRHDHLPYGAGVELVSFPALDRAFREATEPRHREHVTPYVHRNPQIFPAIEIAVGADLATASLSIDYPEDLERNRILITEMGNSARRPYHLRDILAASAALAARGFSMKRTS